MAILLMYYIFGMIFIITLFMFSNFYNQIMLNLICLEFLMLSTFMLMMKFLMLINFLNIILYYLVFVVCEGVLGLSLLMLMIRSNGNDNMNLMNLMLW